MPAQEQRRHPFMKSPADLLHRARRLIRLPTSPDRESLVNESPAGLRCPTTGRVFPFADGVLDLLFEPDPPTFTQRTLDTPLTAWFYDRIRGPLFRLAGLPDFHDEAAAIQERLQVEAGDVVLDLACGHGNFTIEWARRAGPDGLAIGIDISRRMLARAVGHVAEAELDNVLLIRGDAQRLPFAGSSFVRINCSGGFHQLPDLPLALREIARVGTDDAVLTASMFADDPDHPHPRIRDWLKRRFALHFVPLLWLGDELGKLGYGDYQWSARRGFGYTSARRVQGGATSAR